MNDEATCSSEPTKTLRVGLPQSTRRNFVKGCVLFGVVGATGFLQACSSGSTPSGGSGSSPDSSGGSAATEPPGESLPESGESEPSQDDGSDLTLTLTTDAWAEGEEIPQRLTCDGDDVSPQLFWTAIPDGCVELALIVEDDDANGFVHWVVYGIAPTDREFPEGAGIAYPEGLNDFDRDGYGGPCPPSGETHTYRFTFLALNETTDLKPGATAAELRAKTKDTVIETATLTGSYTRPEEA